jgi:hypothetical protein
MIKGPATAGAIAAIVAVLSTSVAWTAAWAQAPAAALKTPWGDPDLQGIWTDESDTPLQRPPKYAAQEFFTPEQRAELDATRTAILKNDGRSPAGSEDDVATGYNSQFWSFKRTGARTSLIVDPPNGRLPPMTPETLKMVTAERDFRLVLLQSTETCRIGGVGCRGGVYDPAPSPRRFDHPPRYNTGRMNRNDGPEDSNLPERCLTGGLPEFGSPNGSFRRIVQTPGGISIFYDVGQGQGWQRNIVMDGRPHLPAHVRQWYGDSRGHWEGKTLVIDVTNFTPKVDFLGTRENLHLVERWTRTGPATLEYVVTIDDPTVWTAPWTARQTFARQSDQANKVYYEPRCIEGNYGLPAQMRGRRLEEAAFAEGRGPDPATRDNTHGSLVLDADPLVWGPNRGNVEVPPKGR